MPVSTGGFVLTSNRDESPKRNTLSPAFYEENEARLLYPKDTLAGGTWIGVSDKNRLICLLNGGFKAHEREAFYRMSRGVIVTSLLSAPNLIKAIEDFDFEGIEPFTIVCANWSETSRLYELVWDGHRVHFAEKPFAPHIWSSSLLYTPEVKSQREKWFSNFLSDHINPSPEELLQFHKTAGEGDVSTNLVMDRGFVKTKSISQFSLYNNSTSLRYEDLKDHSISILRL